MKEVVNNKIFMVLLAQWIGAEAWEWRQELRIILDKAGQFERGPTSRTKTTRKARPVVAA